MNDMSGGFSGATAARTADGAPAADHEALDNAREPIGVHVGIVGALLPARVQAVRDVHALVV